MYQRREYQRRAVSHGDLTAIGCIVIALFSTVVVAVNRVTSEQRERHVADQLRQIHKAFVVSAGGYRGSMLAPSMVRRLPPVGSEERIPGMGPEDLTQNTTANLYSAMIAQNFFRPELVVAANDPNSNVRVIEDYNWEAFDPATAIYWDDRFKADLEKESHASFAHMVLDGMRTRLRWTSADDRIPVLSTRGPRDGKNDPESLTTDDQGNWSGYIMPHPEGQGRIETVTPDWLSPIRPAGGDDKAEEFDPVSDNIFKKQQAGPRGLDVVLTFTQAITDDGPVIQHD